MLSFGLATSATALAGDLTLVSTSDAGTKANSNSEFSSVSDDGTKVAFATIATNLDPADTDGMLDIYVKDLATGEITLASTTAAGDKGNGSSRDPALSGDGTKVAFESQSTNLDPNDTDSTTDLYVKDLITGDLTLASTSDAGVKGNQQSGNPSLSWDGSRVAFDSTATTLDPADTQDEGDVYVKDLTNGDITLASTSDTGVRGAAYDTDPALSTDGWRVAFQSRSRLDPGDPVSGDLPGGGYDIYVKDLSTGDITLASTSDGEVKGTGQAYSPSLSGDARFVAFYSDSSDLDPSDTDAVPDVYVKDLASGDIRLISTSTGLTKGDGASDFPALSRDGSMVAFESAATNLDPADTDVTDDVYVKHLTSGALTLASRSASDVKGNAASHAPSLSADGTAVAFDTPSTNLDPTDTTNDTDVYRKEVAPPPPPDGDGDGVPDATDNCAMVANPDQADIDLDNIGDVCDNMPTVSVDDTIAYEASGSATFDVTLSGATPVTVTVDYATSDGTATAGEEYAATSGIVTFDPGETSKPITVTVLSDADDLDETFLVQLTAPANATLADAEATGIVVESVALSDSIVASTSDDGIKGNDFAYVSTISADGTTVAFTSTATNLDPTDTTADYDVYVKHLTTGDITLVSTTDTGAKGNGHSSGIVMASNGLVVTFSSTSTNLDAADTTVDFDVYVKDLTTGDITLASTSDSGVKGNSDSWTPVPSADGTRVVFTSTATNLDPADTDAVRHVYVKDLTTGELTLASASDAGVKANGSSESGAISPDGTTVAFSSFATNLDPADTGGHSQLYVKDLATGEVTVASTSDAGVPGNESSGTPSLSVNGTMVAFQSSAANLDPGDTDDNGDIFVKDLATGDLTLVNTTDWGTKATHGSGPWLSADGTAVAFYTADKLDPAAEAGATQIYVKYLATGNTVLVSTNAGGDEQGNDGSFAPSLSADGRTVTFSSAATNLDPTDTDNTWDVYVRTVGSPVVQFGLGVAKAGSGGGSVSSSPVGIDCGSTCTANFDTGTVVTLTATPDANSTFTGWSGDCAGTSACQVTMDAAKSVTASFAKVQFGLGVAKTGNGGGSVSSSPVGIDCGPTCTASFDTGTVVTLTAAPDANSTFTGWSGSCAGAGTCQVTMDAAKSVTASFAKVQFELTVTKAGTGGGSVSSSPVGIACGSTCGESFDTGTVVTLTAAPDANSTFAGWSGSCAGSGTCQVTMSAARAVTATFTIHSVRADLRLAIPQVPSVGTGSSFLLPFVVTNLGPDDSLDIILSGTLDHNVVLVGPLPGGCIQPTGPMSLSCTIAPLRAGRTTAVNVRVRSRVVGATCTVWGSSGNDTMIPGTNASDTICGLGGHDTIDGKGGNDTIFGDTPFGAVGFTIATSGSVSSAVPDPVSSNNAVNATTAVNATADGNDTISGDSGTDTVFGQDGGDTIYGDVVSTTDMATGSSDDLFGGSGNDTIRGQGGEDTLTGDAGEDILIGGNARDAIEGGAAKDTIDGGAGDDYLLGGDGNDFIKGGDNNDSVLGQAGNDTIDGGNGSDDLFGGDGGFGAVDGPDTIDGGIGNDKIWGEGGNDTLNGGASTDQIMGGDGNDTIHGDAGTDWLWGDAGVDNLFGDAGGDVLDGGTIPATTKNKLDGGANTDCAKSGPDIRTSIENVGGCALPPP